MKILGKQPSREKCAESGWFATDYLLDAPIDRAFILSLRPLGSFVYLDMLKEPFFKIENDYYVAASKSIQVDRGYYYRVHADHFVRMGEEPIEETCSFTDGILVP